MRKNVSDIKTAFVVALCSMALAGAQAENKQKTPEPDGYKLDWLRWADVSAQPYPIDIRSIADGDPETRAGNMGGPQTGGVIEFAFPESVHVTELRLMQTGSDAFELRADIEGGRSYAEVLSVRRDKKPVVDEWIVFPVDREVHGLRITALSGNVGYRSSYPSYSEIEIYTAKRTKVPEKTPELADARLNAGKEIETPESGQAKIPFTPCIDLWMAGITASDKMPETVEEIEALKGFQNLLEKLRGIDAQGVRMFLETYCGNNKMPWKSDVCYDYGRDTMRGLMEALHRNNLTGSIFLHAWMSPFQPEELMLPMPDRRWDYPYEQSDLVAGKNLYEGYKPDRYPCVVSDDDFRSKWFAIMKEFVEMGGDGVYVMPDEYYFKGHNLDLADCPACEREFKTRYGYDGLPDLPPGSIGHSATPGVGPDPRRVADTTHYRKFKLFEYEMLAELFDRVAGGLKAINPELDLISSGNPGVVYLNNRSIETGLAFDIIGKSKHYTGVQLYGDLPVGHGRMGLHTALARRMRGSHPDAKLVSSIQTLGFKSQSDEGNEIMFYGYLLPHIMNGAEKIDLYRLNYVEKGHGSENRNWWRVIKKGIAMTRLLEAWGVVESVSSAETALLVSRASEDWWYIRAQALMGAAGETDEKGEITGGAPLLHFEEQIGTIRTLAPDEAERKLDFERFRGVYAGRGMEGILIENGVQYDVLYTEREDTLDNLDKYKLLILPFSYSMSDEAFEKIKNAVASGSRLLMLDQLAPTDKFGGFRDVPLLKELVDNENTLYMNVNLAAVGMCSRVRSEFREVLLNVLDDSAGYFNANGARVEFLSRKTDYGMLVYLANWEKTPAHPVLGLALDEGVYQISMSSGLGDELTVKEGRIGADSLVSAQNLKRFGVELAPGEALLVKIEKAR